ncbi:alpha,alpha-phosphotrehalase [Texcoconibacillus texcoconensis]|uniref:Alpha,alpha-phosphotrehalase n=1 Tax=Texcoconibacillus texcoconensis TaxID=1095777 RepID=A0A840QSY8_9BACI|nr:alpha,alpha-phosphotrehalase [Texcoconibacillus texcoconensis]MBB5174642.1 trehalose-6-phosphate hydrolase [Texcoconibacillus texcoconensis]
MTWNEWWRKSVVYQIYPKSFNDTSGNGVGDIQGVIEKLDYLKKLGIDIVWLTPVYESPQNDNGYDISDYYSIHEPYGTMEDVDRLLEEAHKRDLKIMFDIVVNHTSTEHAWFKDALGNPNSEYRDFYIWKDPVDGKEPNNWQSKFGGTAWEFDEESGQYYLHLFDVTQADLNWENEQVRKNVYEMMHYWFEKGVDGFRLDVINLISKDQDFPNDDGSVAPGDGRKFYTDGPRVHEFMQEMNREVFSHYDIVTVGEMSSTTIDDCIKYTNPERKELSMTFNFHHLKVDYPNGEKWSVAPFDFHALKRILSEWQVEMNKGGGWNALFWCNHDQPRVVSRYGDDEKYHNESAKMLATTAHMMQGTPYIYQGEEFGMTDPKFSSINDYRDVETLNIYEMKKDDMPEDELMHIIGRKSRDNSRTPVQWTSEKHGGFTTAEPWIPVASNYESINAEKALEDENSIFYHYQKLIELRKTYDIITYGDYQLLDEGHDSVFAYVRTWKDEQLLVVNNFYGEETTFTCSDHVDFEGKNAECLISNYDDEPSNLKEMTLRPYESVVYHLTKA